MTSEEIRRRIAEDDDTMMILVVSPGHPVKGLPWEAVAINCDLCGCLCHMDQRNVQATEDFAKICVLCAVKEKLVDLGRLADLKSMVDGQEMPLKDGLKATLAMLCPEPKEEQN